ncbi:hypothetical protein Mapa_000661 [Marchantia paleacea]|nr:hypothetical protein Mapa_000661 [Marchantia paleacea]
MPLYSYGAVTWDRGLLLPLPRKTTLRTAKISHDQKWKVSTSGVDKALALDSVLLCFNPGPSVMQNLTLASVHIQGLRAAKRGPGARCCSRPQITTENTSDAICATFGDGELSGIWAPTDRDGNRNGW